MKIKRSFKEIIGLAGVPKNQGISAWRTGMIFDWLLLVIAFWLPLQWYLQAVSHFPQKYVEISDWIIWLTFLIECSILTFLVKYKKKYLLGNWLNLAIIVLVNPFWFIHISQFGVVRLIRLLVLLRIILPWVYSAHRALTLNRIGLTLAVFLITTSFSGIIISTFDTGVKNPFIGIWWAFETVTTVGYGDVIPASPLGKVMAMFVMCMGIVMFSIVTATVSAYFVGKDHKEQMTKLLSRDSDKINFIDQYLRNKEKVKWFASEQHLQDFVASLSAKEKLHLYEILLAELEESKKL